jgi:putative Mn2+ efflux pump MntP
MLIVLSFIANIDSFFISCLTSGKRKSNLTLIIFSPLLHVVLCLAGMLLQYRILFTYHNHLLLWLLLIILISSGLYLFFIYNPAKEKPHKSKETQSIKPTVIMLLLLFCSFDAIIAGVVFAYWNIQIPKSLLFIFIINLLMTLLPILFKSLQQRSL